MRSLSGRLVLAALVVGSVIGLLTPRPAAAQVVKILDSTSVLTFTASADHNAMSLDGTTPLVTGYRIDVWLRTNVTFNTATPPVPVTTTGPPFASYTIGKPTPVTGTITTVPLLQLKGTAQIAPNVQYALFVSAIGPGGEGRSSVGAGPFGTVAPPSPPGAPAIQ